MTVFLVRHGDALSRNGWMQDDELRPLTEKGHRQAAGIVELLGDRRIGQIISSPAVRCTQTVEPLAAERGLKIVSDPALCEGSALRPARQLLDDLDHAVVCSHGDLIPDLLNQLMSEGLDGLVED